MPRPKLNKEERKLRLNVRLKQKYICQLKEQLKEDQTLSDLIETIIVKHLKKR